MATFVIAEAGVNHNGDLAKAFELVEAASAAGADAVKFQTFTATDLVTPQASKADYQLRNDGIGSQLEMLERLELSYQDHLKIAKHCNKCGISFLSTAFGIKELEILLAIGISSIKVPSGEITHLPLLEAMAHTAILNNIPILLSTGMSTLGEVEQALQVFLDAGLSRNQITLLHCLSSYPAPQDQINLRAMSALANSFDCPVGYSDHTLGITAPVAAVALGACVIEKHLTLDQNLPGPDHQASLEPLQFAEMVKAIRSCELMLGSGIKAVQPSELDNRYAARRSVRASHTIKSGTILTQNDLLFQRPFNGMSPMRYPELLGRESSRDYKKGDVIDF